MVQKVKLQVSVSTRALSSDKVVFSPWHCAIRHRSHGPAELLLAVFSGVVIRSTVVRIGGTRSSASV